MALTDENGSSPFTMPVQPMYGGGYGNGDFGGFGNYWCWIILLLLCGWGNGGFGMGGGFAGGLGYDFPWLLNGQNGINNNVNDGFRDQMLQTTISSVGDKVTSGFGDVALGIAGINQNICQTGNSVVSAVTGAQGAISQQLYNNEIASLNRSFAEQTANTAGFNGVQSGLCDIRYGNANNTRDILTALTAGVQSIKDQLCQDKIDAKNDEIAQLRQEVLYARGQASQDVQTARILAGQASEIDGVYNRLKNCPVPSMPVYGMQPVFTCQPQQSCGCGCGFAN